MKTFRFTVIGEPKPQPRPRAFARKICTTYTARVYDAGTAEGWKSEIALAARKAGLDGIMSEGPVLLEVACYFRRPKSHYGMRKGESESVKPKFRETRKTSKPDLDNIMKAVKDCLSAIGAWKDDAQVCHEMISKEWTTKQSFTEFYINIDG